MTTTNSNFLRMSVASLVIPLTGISGCAGAESTANKNPDTSSSLFVEVKDVIPFEDRNRRKFDAPVIGDLDQDGLSDLIVNEHGRGMRVFWNEGATFSEGPYIANGDVHGATISDFNKDGVLDIIITQGGGDGGNPRRPLWVEVRSDRSFTKGKPFDYFEPGRGRATNFIPEAGTGNLNLLVTGFPMPAQTEGANHFYQNIGAGAFEFDANLPQAKWLGYRPRLTDFNNDGFADVIFYGGANIIAVAGNADGTFTDNSETVFGNLTNTSDVTSITEIDFDNDGDQDLFLTRGEHQFDIESYYDAETRRFAFITFRKDYRFDDILVEGDLILDNLQRTYPHRQVFLGADKTPMKFEGDPHGHQDVTIKVEDALGWPEGETTGGMYIGYIGDGYWRIAGQSRSRTAATIRNVDAAPAPTPQKELAARLFENQGDKFKDVTAQFGIDTPDQTTGATTADFNNDGWLDLAVLRYGSMAVSNKHVLYLNQGGTGFMKASDHGIQAPEVGTTGGFAQAFDYDANGTMDIIFSNERGKWHLMKNEMTEATKNNFVTVDIGQSPVGNGPLGATLKLEACGRNYKRQVGTTSAAFSQNFDTALHVGIGSCKTIQTATVTWPDGGLVKLNDVDVNMVIPTP